MSTQTSWIFCSLTLGSIIADMISIWSKQTSVQSEIAFRLRKHNKIGIWVFKTAFTGKNSWEGALHTNLHAEDTASILSAAVLGRNIIASIIWLHFKLDFIQCSYNTPRRLDPLMNCKLIFIEQIQHFSNIFFNFPVTNVHCFQQDVLF